MNFILCSSTSTAPIFSKRESEYLNSPVHNPNTSSDECAEVRPYLSEINLGPPARCEDAPTPQISPRPHYEGMVVQTLTFKGISLKMKWGDCDGEKEIRQCRADRRMLRENQRAGTRKFLFHTGLHSPVSSSSSPRIGTGKKNMKEKGRPCVAAPAIFRDWFKG